MVADAPSVLLATVMAVVEVVVVIGALLFPSKLAAAKPVVSAPAVGVPFLLEVWL